MKLKRPRDGLEKGVEDIASGIKELVELRKNSHPAHDASPQLKYLSMYTNYDRMFKHLPERVVEDLNMEISNLIYNKMKEQEKILIVNLQE